MAEGGPFIRKSEDMTELLNSEELIYANGVYLLIVEPDDSMEIAQYFITTGLEYMEFKQVAMEKTIMLNGKPFFPAQYYKDFFYSRHKFVPFVPTDKQK